MGAKRALAPVTASAGHVRQYRVRHQIFVQRQMIKIGALKLIVHESLGFLVLDHLAFIQMNQVGHSVERLALLEMSDQLIQRVFTLGQNDAVKNFQEDLKRPGTLEPHRVYNWLALSYYSKGNYDHAERQWLKALELKDNAAIRLNLALAYKDQERFDQALESLKKAVVLNPEFPQAHYEMSQLFILNKEMDQAVRHFKKVIRLAPRSEWARLSKKYLDLIQQPKN